MTDCQEHTVGGRNANCWVLLGPTASGKTELSVQLARTHPVEIVSIDSMQIYRGMDIGTAKPPRGMLEQAPHHMIDVVEPVERFSVGRFRQMACAAIDGIRSRGNRPLLVCGTPLYLKALLWGLFEGPEAHPEIRRRLRRQASRHGPQYLHRQLAEVDPAAAERIDPADLKRVERALEVYQITGRPISERQDQFTGPPLMGYVAVGLRWPRWRLYKRIEQRVDQMMQDGLLDEARALKGGLGPQARQAVGYRELLAHLDGKPDLPQAVELIKRRTRRVAKGQITWFRHFPGVQWIDLPVTPSEGGLAESCESAFSSLEHCAPLGYD